MTITPKIAVDKDVESFVDRLSTRLNVTGNSKGCQDLSMALQEPSMGAGKWEMASNVNIEPPSLVRATFRANDAGLFQEFLSIYGGMPKAMGGRQRLMLEALRYQAPEPMQYLAKFGAVDVETPIFKYQGELNSLTSLISKVGTPEVRAAFSAGLDRTSPEAEDSSVGLN